MVMIILLEDLVLLLFLGLDGNPFDDRVVPVLSLLVDLSNDDKATIAFSPSFATLYCMES